MEDKNKTQLDEMQHMLAFIKDNAVTGGEFSELKSDVGELKSDVSELKSEFSELKSDVGELKSDVSELKDRASGIESQMVTKSYLDEKLSDLRGDLVVMMRKEDSKLKSLVEILVSKKVISSEDAAKVEKMEPFARI